MTFVDYGNTEVVQLSCLTRLMPLECQLSAQAMECYLTCVRPSVAHSEEDSTWAESATAHFGEVIRDRRLVAKVRVRVGRSDSCEVCDECVVWD